MSELANHSDLAYKKAEEFNCDVVIPDEYTLQLDIDGYYDKYKFDKLLACLDRNFGIAEGKYTAYDYKETTSRNGNTHIYIRLQNPVTPTERILFQAALGSDGVRELLSFARVKRGDPTPTLLFEPKATLDKAAV